MLSTLNRFFRKESLPMIPVFGLDAAGKTTLVYKLASTEVVTTIPSIGMVIETAGITIRPPGGKQLRFTTKACDVGGCSNLGPLIRRVMLENVSAVIWVINAYDRDRLVESVEEFSHLFPKLGSKETDVCPSDPFLILINQVDLVDAKELDAIRAKFDKLLTRRRAAFFETSFTNPSLESSGLPEAFAWLDDALTSTSVPTVEDSSTKQTKKPVKTILTDMRSPLALTQKLEQWLERTEKDDTAEQFLDQFFALDLPNWDHYTHLRLAYILLLKYGRREGKDKIFEGFKKYIDESGKIHGRSFHMTMTYFWIQMVHFGIANMGMNKHSHTLHSLNGKEQEDACLDDFADFLIVNPFIVDGQLWADYYSKETLMSPGAKEAVVLPDIKPMPDIVSRDTVMLRN